MRDIDLNVAAPETVQLTLRRAADQYRESSGELAAAWQDKIAGSVWNDIARILDRAADSCERACIRHGL